MCLVPAPVCEIFMEPLAPGFDLAQTQHCGCLGSESADGKPL